VVYDLEPSWVYVDHRRTQSSVSSLRLKQFTVLADTLHPGKEFHTLICLLGNKLNGFSAAVSTYKSIQSNSSYKTAAVKVPLDARERSSCTSSYWDPSFPHFRFHKNVRWPTV